MLSRLKTMTRQTIKPSGGQTMKERKDARDWFRTAPEDRIFLLREELYHLWAYAEDIDDAPESWENFRTARTNLRLKANRVMEESW